MIDQIARTPIRRFERFAATDLTTSAFPEIDPTYVAPTGNGVVDMAVDASYKGLGGDGVGPNTVILVPFAVDDNNQTFSLRVTGWESYDDGTNGKLWVPILLLDIACTTSATTANVGGTTHNFCDTITKTTGDDSVVILSPGSDMIGHVMFDPKGFRKLQLTCDLGTAAGGNTFLKKL